jgi:VanZ family protein
MSLLFDERPACGAIPTKHPPVKTLSPRVWQAITIITAVAVLALALSPAPPRALDSGWDKANHVLAFAMLGMMANLAWSNAWRWVALLGYGALVEVLQGWTPSRQASWADVGADALGLALAAVLGFLFSRLRRE